MVPCIAGPDRRAKVVKLFNPTQKKLRFLVGEGTPRVVSEEAGGKLKLTAGFTCQSESPHDDFHFKKVELAPGKSMELEVDEPLEATDHACLYVTREK